VLALAQLEVELDDIQEGSNAVMKWQGKPLFVRHRTAKEIEAEQGADLADLKDPQSDTDRVKKDQWLVVLGICESNTNLPTAVFCLAFSF
jgi:ubiquinol-cytochrome c reductase iron-sulfur subunit